MCKIGQSRNHFCCLFQLTFFLFNLFILFYFILTIGTTIFRCVSCFLWPWNILINHWTAETRFVGHFYFTLYTNKTVMYLIIQIVTLSDSCLVLFWREQTSHFSSCCALMIRNRWIYFPFFNSSTHLKYTRLWHPLGIFLTFIIVEVWCYLIEIHTIYVCMTFKCVLFKIKIFYIWSFITLGL